MHDWQAARRLEARRKQATDVTDILEIFVEAARWATLPVNPPAGFRLVAFALAPQVPYSERRD